MPEPSVGTDGPTPDDEKSSEKPSTLAFLNISDQSQRMDADQIQQVRRFNRLVTQRVGALEESYLRRGRPLGEARLIFETGADGVDVRSLRNKLGLDSGYLSRLLRSLEAQRLVRVRKPAGDGRMRQVGLTEKGRAEFAAYETLSDELAKSMLAPLDASQRDRLVAAMTEIERLLRVGAIEVSVEPPNSADARWCRDEYFRELAERFETGFDPAQGGADEGCFGPLRRGTERDSHQGAPQKLVR